MTDLWIPGSATDRWAKDSNAGAGLAEDTVRFWPCGWAASPGEEVPLVLAPARALRLFELPDYSSLNFPALLGASRPGFRSILWLPKLYDF